MTLDEFFADQPAITAEEERTWHEQVATDQVYARTLNEWCQMFSSLGVTDATPENVLKHLDPLCIRDDRPPDDMDDELAA